MRSGSMPSASQPVRNDTTNESSGRPARTRRTGSTASSGVTPISWKPSPSSVARR